MVVEKKLDFPFKKSLILKCHTTITSQVRYVVLKWSTSLHLKAFEFQYNGKLRSYWDRSQYVEDAARGPAKPIELLRKDVYPIVASSECEHADPYDMNAAYVTVPWLMRAASRPQMGSCGWTANEATLEFQATARVQRLTSTSAHDCAERLDLHPRCPVVLFCQVSWCFWSMRTRTTCVGSSARSPLSRVWSR